MGKKNYLSTWHLGKTILGPSLRELDDRTSCILKERITAKYGGRRGGGGGEYYHKIF